MRARKDPVRAQLVEARRAQILDAATKVFSEKGFHRATTKEIAEVAGVSEGTIYNYFDGKYALLLGIMMSFADQQPLEYMLAQAPDGSVRDWFVNAFRLRQEFIRQRGAMLQAVLSEVLINQEFGGHYYQEIVLPFLERTEHYLQRQIEQGQMRPVDAAWAARLFFAISVGLVVGAAVRDPLLLSEWEDPDRLAGILTDLVFDGLGRGRES